MIEWTSFLLIFCLCTGNGNCNNGTGPSKLFALKFVDMYGHDLLEELNNDDKPLKLMSKL